MERNIKLLLLSLVISLLAISCDSQKAPAEIQIEETEVVIEQPIVEETSNLMPVLSALALVLVAVALLFRMRSKNKG